jgi:lipopolysaccharide transport system permease protein
MNNPHQPLPISLKACIVGCYANRVLIQQMTRRDVLRRYKGSVMGILWSFFNPILMLTVYTLVFSLIFKQRWGATGDENNFHFALLLFIGMIVHSFVAEVLNRSSTLIFSHVNYVKKIVFPLEILPIMTVGTALFHSLISLFALMVAYLFFVGPISWTFLFIPCLVLPLCVFTLGLAWIVASLAVFLRDISQMVNLLTLVMLFLAPVFYPMTAVPTNLRLFILANPLTFIIEQIREILIWRHTPNWAGMGLYSLIAILVAWAGYAWFQKSRRWFADVV